MTRCHSCDTTNVLLCISSRYASLTPNPRRTYELKMAKLAVTRALVGQVVCSSYVTHQPEKVISYSWILAITRAYSPLKLTSSATSFNHQKRSSGTCQFHFRWPDSQLDPPLVASLCRLVLIHSMASYVVRHGRKSVASHSWKFYLMQTFAESHR